MIEKLQLEAIDYLKEINISPATEENAQKQRVVTFNLMLQELHSVIPERQGQDACHSPHSI
jgi:hypothetical protein